MTINLYHDFDYSSMTTVLCGFVVVYLFVCLLACYSKGYVASLIY